MPKYHKLVWSAMGGANPLDYINEPLQTRDGRKVELLRSSMIFIVTVDGKLVSETPDNAATCYLLNAMETGVLR